MNWREFHLDLELDHLHQKGWIQMIQRGKLFKATFFDTLISADPSVRTDPVELDVQADGRHRSLGNSAQIQDTIQWTYV